MARIPLLFLTACLLLDQSCQPYGIAETAHECHAESETCSSDAATAGPNHDLNGCRLVLAARTPLEQQYHDATGRKLGVYANAPIMRGMPLLPSRGDITGDLVLHLIDVPEDETTSKDSASQLNKWLSHGFLLDASSSGYGGNYEGNGRILTALPGLGMLASSFRAGESINYSDAGKNQNNGTNTPSSKKGPNTWASIPTTDEANQPRRYSPLAGSFALNYNLTFRATRPLSRHEEVTVDRSGWFRSNILHSSRVEDGNSDTQAAMIKQYENEVCLDAIIYPSRAKNGRGAFASKFIPEGSVLAYSPVLPVSREELLYLRKKEKKKENVNQREQLLLNYCFGHSNSSVLLFPYGPFVNFINHAPSVTGQSSEDETDATVANVRVRWSEMFRQKDDVVDPRSMTPPQLWKRPNPDGLVLEYVALRNIQPNEEILLDYGSAWSNAWKEHTKRWKDDPSNHDSGPESINESKSNDYSPAYIMDDVVSNLRTAEEQLQFPYPQNVFTACFYRYEHTEESNNEVKSSIKTLNKATPWRMSRGLFDMVNLRPCKVIARETATDSHSQSGKNFYTAVIQNRPGLSEIERIPKGVKHIVSGIPREAFRFVDRPYSSDEHFDGAFRHFIGLDETGIFPKSWLDEND
ncbi:hypothetical protein HJC23_006632 [Cyclotella cryptica]|uniref:SET domain-containing protein n=1 Tax=Cyclotella cryptica TaxID=29204 RepID=A0ABD3QX43_9STRA|eukprot:CCRYP_001055-RA/>CCRYP_001055-RA protein AED:0.32 eAED:0.32 QI:0/-1/0/1/-1/1/1/0/636